MDGDLDGDLAAFTANLAAFDAAAARACLTLDRVAEAAGHVELGCAPVLALTSQLLLSHRNVESVHACLADIERFTTVADRVQHALNALTTAEDIASRETVVVAQHDDLDALVDVMLEAERFLEANDYLPDVKDAAAALHIAKAKAIMWYSEQLVLMAAHGVAAAAVTTATTPENFGGSSSSFDVLPPATTRCKGVPSSSPDLIKAMISLGAGDKIEANYVNAREPLVRKRFEHECADGPRGSHGGGCVAAVRVHALVSVFAEEARFVHAVFGPLDEGAFASDDVNLGLRRSVAMACLTGVMKRGAVTPFLEATEALVDRLAFAHDEFTMAIDICRSYFGSFGGSIGSSPSKLSTSSTESAAAKTGSSVGPSSSTFTVSPTSIPISQEDRHAAEVTLKLSHKIFQNLENGTIVDVCSLIAAADAAIKTVEVSVRGGAQIAPAMELVREALSSTSASGKMVLRTFALMQLPEFSRLGADLLIALGRSDANNVSPAFVIGAKFAIKEVRLAAVERLLLDAGTAIHTYELGVCRALIEAAVSLKHPSQNGRNLHPRDPKAAALQQLLILISMMKTSPLAPYNSTATYIAAAASVLSTQSSTLIPSTKDAATFVAATATALSNGAYHEGLLSSSKAGAMRSRGTPAKTTQPISVAPCFNETSLREEMNKRARHPAPSLVQVKALTQSLNNVHFLKGAVLEIDDDGSLVQSIGQLEDDLCIAVVGELTGVFKKHAALPVDNMPADLSNRKPNTTSAFCRDLKARFAAMNKFIDLAQETGEAAPVGIADSGLRSRVQSAAQQVMSDKYAVFYRKFSKVRFSKKHQQEYTRWEPEDAERVIVGELTK